MKLLVSTQAPFHWVRLNKRGKPVARGRSEDVSFLQELPKGINSIVGIMPSELVTIHSVEVPTNRHANMLAAVPFVLEERLSQDINELHFAVLDWKPGQPAKVAVTSKAAIDAILRHFKEAEVTLDSIVPDHSLLPVHPTSDATVVKTDDERYIVKHGDFDTVVMDEDAFNYWWQSTDKERHFAVNTRGLAEAMKQSGGEEVSLWDIGSHFAQWVDHTPLTDPHRYSLLRAEYEPDHLKPNNHLLTAAVALAACALLLLGGSNWLELEKLKGQHQANQDEIKSLFTQAFPDQEYLDQPRRQIASLLSIDETGGPNEDFQYLLQAAADAAARNNAEFVEINFRNNTLQVGVSAPNFAALEVMTSQLDDSQRVRAALVSSGSQANQVTGQIKLIVSGS